MIHSFAELKEKIYFQTENTISLGLERMNHFLGILGNPQDSLKVIHIGGTNGKGSTLRFLEGILSELGLTVGTFHSPAYRYVNDQITVSGKEITDDELIEILKTFNHMGLTNAKLTDFELLTAIAFYYFERVKKVDIALVEVGLGGKDDSTNVLTPILSVITNVGNDHAAFLGNSLREIAIQKAGIIKNDIPIVSGERKEEVQSVLKTEAAIHHSPYWFLESEFDIKTSCKNEFGESFSFLSSNARIEHLHIGMYGDHQIRNAALAVMSYLLLVEQKVIKRNDVALRKGLIQARHPGRLEIIQQKPTIIMDGAHNEEAVEELVKTIKRRFPGKRTFILFSALLDKPVDKMLKRLEEISYHITFTSFDFPRAAEAEKLFEKSHSKSKEFNESWELAIHAILPKLQEDDLLLITGSLYFISELRTYFTDGKLIR